ncbi:MAG: type II secretion system secretin GspD [Gammaproteobacteria bacterium]|nr:type II secretion system secretin GspD [Gammaproteobacteria bacterium]MDH5734765.1 type II secretion system secretin GspD [Gammaproteobacteria bacterium]
MLLKLHKQITEFSKRFILICIVCLLAQHQASAEQITLNLKEADIRALISTVSRFTGKNFIVDPRIKAKVTVVSAKTMSESEVYEVFLSILQVHGFAAVPVGNVIKIIPEVNAKQGPVPTVTHNRSSGDELVTRVLTLDYVPAAQLVPILRPLVPQQGHLAAYNPTNTLIITDHGANIKRLTDIIRSIDKPESDELEIIPLKHASANELVRILNSLQGKTAGTTPQTQQITLAADERTNSILMSGERAERLKIRATIAHLDTPLENDGNTHVIYLNYAKAEDMVKILTGVEKTQTQAAKGKVAAPVSSNIPADIQADEATNAIIITASPDVVRRLKSIIRQLDIRRAQVLVESIIAEISNNKSKQYGSQFAIGGDVNATGSTPIGVSNFGGNSGILGLLAARTNPASAASVIGDGITLGAGSDKGTRFAFLLKALAGDGATNILSTPSIVTLDNQEAKIVVGKNVPFVTGQFTNTGAATGTVNPFQTIERQDVGITLKVTPQINEGDTIKLDIEQEVSSLAAGADTSSGPTTNKRTLNTSVLVEDGEILILGGLIDDTMLDSEQRVPILGDIPILGWLFRSHTTTKDKQNLMVFMRPSILRDKYSAQQQTNEKYNYLRAQQIQAGEFGFGLLSDEQAPLLPELKTPEEKPETEVKPKANMIEEDDKDFL